MATDLKVNKLTLAVLISLGVVVMFFLLSMGRGRGYVSESIKLSELISASIDVARNGGKRVVEIRNMDDTEIGTLSKGMTKEGKAEYVTIGDKVWPLNSGISEVVFCCTKRLGSYNLECMRRAGHPMVLRNVGAGC